MAKNFSVRVGTPKAVRLSYAHVLKPYAAAKDQEAKYSVQLMIPKTDKATKQALMDAARECFENNPAIFKGYDFEDLFSLQDGDGKSPKGKKYGSEMAGFWLRAASNKRKPKVIDKQRNEIMDEDEVYSGCWAKVGLTMYPYSVSGNVGIGCSLDLVMKTKDDEPFGFSADPDSYGFTSDDDEDDDI